MAQTYRTLKVEPSFRLIATDGEHAGGRDGKRTIRLESSFRIVGDDARPHAARPAQRAVDTAIPQRPEPNFPSGKNLFEELVRKAPDAIFLVGAEGRIQFANPACLSLLGYQPEELVGEPIERLVPEEARAAHPLHRAGFHADAPTRPMARIGNLNAVHKDGRLIPVDVTVSPLDRNGDNPIYVVTVHDVTAQSALISRLETLATTDPLTGVPNRRSFDAASARELERLHRHGSPLSVMIIDIDHFKSINDTYGHKVGDEALVCLTSACLSKLRRTDLLARIGGEEFAILIPGNKSAEAMILAERVRDGIGKIRIQVGETVVHFTASIGLAEVNPSDQAITAAMERADQALYQAKRNGRNRTVLSPPVGDQ